MCRYQFLTPLCKRLFMIFDEDKSGALDFTVGVPRCHSLMPFPVSLPEQKHFTVSVRTMSPSPKGVRDVHVELRFSHRGSAGARAFGGDRADLLVFVHRAQMPVCACLQDEITDFGSPSPNKSLTRNLSPAESGVSYPAKRLH